jgi:hypothetical protein
MIEIKNAADLDELYNQAESADKSEFAKMRSNILLIAGDHYNKNGSRAWERIRTFQDFEKSMKLRLTKNHFGKIARQYSNLVITACPDAKPLPKHEREMRDQKSAELYQAIWQDGKEINAFESKKLDFVDDFMHIGEVYCKQFYDPNAGQLLGYNQAKDPNTGEDLFEQVVSVDPMTGQQIVEQGNPIQDPNSPKFEGQIKMERIYAFNVLLDPNCDGFADSPYVGIRKNVPISILKKMFPKQADKIRESAERPFLVFDMDQGYRPSDKKKETMVREWYLRPSPEQPSGYYYIAIDGHILDEGELPKTPEGKVIFPIICEYADKIQTKRRGVSPLNALRPIQSEINRAASKVAETQVTLGDDKLIITNGSKVSSGAKLPGIRSITVTGQPPTILPGRSGDQYLGYMQSQISELYQIAELDEKETYEGQLDPHMLLYRSGSQKRKFNRYIKRFEMFLIRMCETYIDLAKTYFSDERFVRAVGQQEVVNIAEFKRVEGSHVQIVVEASSDDIESQLGKQLVANHILQYVGTKLDEGSIAKLIRNMPFSNLKDSFADLTMDDEMATNDMLAMDRGEVPTVQNNDNHDYLMKRASTRMKQPDFATLADDVKETYQVYIQAHGDVMNQKAEALQRAQSGFIPDSGAMVKADYYYKDPSSPDAKAKRAEFPVSSLEWLFMKLQEQGSFKTGMENAPLEVVESVADTVAPQPQMAQDMTIPQS